MCKRIEFNHAKLRGLLKEKDLTQKELAIKAGLNSASLSQKLNNTAAFTATEIFNICHILNISEESIKQYFFTRKVQKQEQK